MTYDLQESDLTEQTLRKCISNSRSRFELWSEVIRSIQPRRMAEIGVNGGEFAEAVASLRRPDKVLHDRSVEVFKRLEQAVQP